MFHNDDPYREAKKLVDNHMDVNALKTVRYRNRFGGVELQITPILAAIMVAPDRLAELIDAGADVNYVAGTKSSPISCVTQRAQCRRQHGIYQNDPYQDRFDVLEGMKLLLDHGADANGLASRNYSAHRSIADYIIYSSKQLGDEELSKLALLSSYGADIKPEDTQFLKDTHSDKNMYGDHRVLIRYIKKLGLAKGLAEFAVFKERARITKEKRARKKALASEKWNQKYRTIQAHIRQDQKLAAALNELLAIAAENKALERIVRRQRFGVSECETGSNNTYFKSQTCESEGEPLMRRVKDHFSRVNAAYTKQRDWFAGLFGEHASIVRAIVDDRYSNTRASLDIEEQYAPAFRQLRRITKAEANAERSARQRHEQKMMADFMNNIQNTFEKTNRMLDRSMARTRQKINLAYASQDKPNVTTGSGYQARNAPAMRHLDKKLEKIDRSFSASKGTKNLPDIGSAPVKPSHRVCGGPFTVSAMNQVFDLKAINSGKAEPPIECSAGGTPVMEGSYNLEAHFINWLMRPPNYRKEAIRNENGRPSGRFRVSWDAFSYECLCSNRSGGQPSGSYQQ